MISGEAIRLRRFFMPEESYKKKEGLATFLF